MRYVALVVALVAVSPPLAGQQLPALAPGARVRVTVANAESRGGLDVHVGPYVGRSDVALVLQPGRAELSVPLDRLRSVEVSRGRKLSVLGGTFGFLIGGTVGFFAVGCLANKDSYGVPCIGQDDSKYVLGALAGGLAGAVLGALLFRRELWQAVELPPTTAPATARE